MLGADVHRHDHERQLRARRHLEPTRRFFHGHRGRERPERFTHLHHGVDAVAHAGVAGVGENAAMSQSPGPELQASAIPRHHAAIRDQARGPPARLGESGEPDDVDSIGERRERRVDVRAVVARPQKRDREAHVSHVANCRRAIQGGA